MKRPEPTFDKHPEETRAHEVRQWNVKIAGEVTEVRNENQALHREPNYGRQHVRHHQVEVNGIP